MKSRMKESVKKKENRKEKSLGHRAAEWILGAAIAGVLLGSCAAIWNVLHLAEEYPPETRGPEAAARRTAGAPAELPSVSAEAALLMDADNGAVLYEKNADKRMYPASTTKIMTALVVLETLEALGLGTDSQVMVPEEAEGIEGSSLYLKVGERLAMEELLYGLMLQSGNDSAQALAICTGGTEENFIRQMNQRCREIGCMDTHFMNPSGLHDENHYTTARDLARIAREAMKREDFRSIAGCKKWSSEKNSEGGGRSFVNKNKTLFQYEGGNGVKIGFTKASGRTLVAAAQRGEKQLIAVVLKDGNWFQDAYRMMDYGFRLAEQEQEEKQEQEEGPAV